MLFSHDVVGQFRVPANHRVRRVAQKLAERFKVPTVAEELPREGTAEVVRGYAPFSHPGPRRCSLDDLIDPLAADGLPRMAREQRIVQLQASGDEIAPEPTHRLNAEGKDALVLTLLDDADAPLRQIDVAHPNSSERRDPKTCVKDQVQDHEIANALEAAAIDRLEHGGALLGRRRPHRFLAHEGLAELVERIRSGVNPFCDQEGEEPLAHGPVSEDRLRGQRLPAMPVLAKGAEELRNVGASNARRIGHVVRRQLSDDSDASIAIPLEGAWADPSCLTIGKVHLQPCCEIEVEALFEFRVDHWWRRLVQAHRTHKLRRFVQEKLLPVEGKEAAGYPSRRLLGQVPPLPCQVLVLPMTEDRTEGGGRMHARREANEEKEAFPVDSIAPALEAIAGVLARHLAEALKPLIASQMNASAQMTQAEELPPLLKVQEAAKLLRIGRDTAYELVRTHRIPSISLGRRIVIPTAKLFELLNDGKIQSEASLADSD